MKKVIKKIFWVAFGLLMGLALLGVILGRTSKNNPKYTLDNKNLGEYGFKVVFNKGTELEEHDVVYKLPAGRYKVTNLDSVNKPVVSVFTDAIINDEILGDDYYGVSADSKSLEYNKSMYLNIHDDELVCIQTKKDIKGFEFERVGEPQDSKMVYSKEYKPIKTINDLKEE